MSVDGCVSLDSIIVDSLYISALFSRTVGTCYGFLTFAWFNAFYLANLKVRVSAAMLHVTHVTTLGKLFTHICLYASV